MNIENDYINFAFCLLILWTAISPCVSEAFMQSPQPAAGSTAGGVITVLYDNNRLNLGLKARWGFSCLVEGYEKSILFDTGGDSSVLLYNMGRLGIKPSKIEVIILSHNHSDHTGGARGFLMENNDVLVYLPNSFPGSFKQMLASLGAHVKEISGAKKLFHGVYTSGELGNNLIEHSLIIKTDAGLVIITGCAHPGVVEIIQKAKEITGENKIYLVMGGFHLAGEPTSRIKSILEEFKCLSVQKAAPCHCSGDEARRLFKQAYAANCIECGVGKRILLPPHHAKQ
ncbi:MAG: MBL fold metallo-hydrolase [Syntrophaceae bacterium]|nr:MBL fold metallo-hydrolase [Syntrophaceae bacterium]